MPKPIRTFVAVEISEDARIRVAALIDRLAVCGAEINWVEPDNLHLTLNFLGDVDLIGVAEICREVTKVTANHAAFHLDLQGVGAFPDLRRPRSLWVGAGCGTDEIQRLQGDLTDALVRQGFRGEGRRFKPHLTVGRVRGGQGIDRLVAAIHAEAEFAAGRIPIDEVVVFSSELNPEGPIYLALGRGELA